MADPDYTKVQTEGSPFMYDKVQTTDGLTAEQWKAGNSPDGRLRDRNGMIIERPVEGYVSPDRQIRIEALRAASRVVAGIHAGGGNPMNEDGGLILSSSATLTLAEQFARWLETGGSDEGAQEMSTPEGCEGI